MKTEDRLLSLTEKLEVKEQALKREIEKKAASSQNIKRLKGEIAAVSEEIRMVRRDDLGEFLEQRGIAFEDIFAAVESGLFDKPEAAETKTDNADSTSDEDVLEKEEGVTGDTIKEEAV